MELFEQIRREYEHGVGTIKGVARKFKVHRRMVREAVANAMPRERKIAIRERPRLKPAVVYIDAILEEDRKARGRVTPLPELGPDPRTVHQRRTTESGRIRAEKRPSRNWLYDVEGSESDVQAIAVAKSPSANVVSGKSSRFAISLEVFAAQR